MVVGAAAASERPYVMSQGTHTAGLEAKLPRVHYVRHPGMSHDPEPAENSLLGFVYDVGVGACGVFPPVGVLNEYLLHGGSRGGMSPGYTWESFSISHEEYDLLTEAIRTIPPDARMRPPGWWVPPALVFDPEFDGEPETYPIYPGYKGLPPSIGRCPPGLERYFAWMAAVCGKHRDRYHAEVCWRPAT